MGATKSSFFTKMQNEMADFMKAMGHPARVAIMEYLAKSDSCVCSSIVDEIPLAQPTISQHLKELKNIGLIKGIIEGKNICYCIDKPVLEKYLLRLNEILRLTQETICCK